jgi:PAS domain S-box-containing protein
MLSNCEVLLENVQEGILMLDKNGVIIYCNKTASSITGYRSEELMNQSIAIFYDWDTIKSEYELRVAEKKGTFYSEGYRIKKDKTTFWGELLISPLPGQKDAHGGFSCVLRDITEKKNLELELRKSEERYRLMVEGVKEYSIFMLDPTGRVMTWNEGGKRIKGYSPTEIIGKHFSIFYTPDDLESKKPQREIEIAIKTGKYEEEGWRVKKNGSVFWANIVLTSLFNETNELIGFSKVTRDLSERRENEEVLRHSEERYRSLVEQVTDYGIFMLDEKGRITSWNEGAKKMKGYSRDEIIGKYFSIFYPPEDIIIGKPANELRIAISQGKYEEEGWRLRKDGSRFWASVVITAVYNSHGILIGFSKVTKDLTERKEGEKALLHSFEQTRRLAEQLQRTNRELSETNQELEQFTSIVSHDLQEPVRTIQSFLQIIDQKLEKREYADLKTYIGKSINASLKMKELIRNLLNYSQVSKGTLDSTSVSVKQLVEDALQNLKTFIDQAGALIHLDFRVKQVIGDRVQLVQLLQNLINNAIKFTDRQKPMVSISCIPENGHVKFAISDNGIGINQGDYQKIFDIFRRLNSDKQFAGTGIGLAICKKIVERHNGKIWPESEAGKGTTFYFTLNENIKEGITADEKIHFTDH